MKDSKQRSESPHRYIDLGAWQGSAPPQHFKAARVARTKSPMKGLGAPSSVLEGGGFDFSSFSIFSFYFPVSTFHSPDQWVAPQEHPRPLWFLINSSILAFIGPSAPLQQDHTHPRTRNER
jgi:hypothetical protein